jgi:hypothetical protein
MSKVLRVNQIKLTPNQGVKELHKKLCATFKLKSDAQIDYEIVKKSIDSRHKPEIFYVYSVDVRGVKIGGKNIDIMSLKRDKNVNVHENVVYSFPKSELAKSPKLSNNMRPVVVGFGPAGIFCALKLAEAGLEPVVFERGQSVDERTLSVEKFWESGELNTESNVQFGEGGAGTFSDGKLNTGVKDPEGRIRDVLETFVKFGADSQILSSNKPHIGTDVLKTVVANIRNHIIELGGEIHFNSRVSDIAIENGRVVGLTVTDTAEGKTENIAASAACFAVGHSARDTFKMLHGKNLEMQPKPFAVGLRLEHPQELINRNAYGDCKYNMPAADYKVTYQTSRGRGVYSFCMCPGGYVVNASSENEGTAVNGMSYSGRDGVNANSAIIVTVTPDDFGKGVLDGVEFQRKLEKLAYREGNGNVPVQLVADFKNNRISSGFGSVIPQIKGKYRFGNLNNCLPSYVSEAIKEGMGGFDRYIRGFDMEDAVFAGVETRTSSPVKILRDEHFNSSVKGLFPCGEGAGYAGGITSAAVDGVRTAEKINDFLDKICYYSR